MWRHRREDVCAAALLRALTASNQLLEKLLDEIPTIVHNIDWKHNKVVRKARKLLEANKKP